MRPVPYRTAGFWDRRRVLARRRRVHDLLLGLPDAEVLFFPNPGNAGDSLIYVATLQAFRRAGVRARRIGVQERDVNGRIVLIGGGGNLVPRYGNVRSVVEAVHRESARLILLPHTVRGHEDLISALPPRHMVICRDRVTYQHVRSVGEVTAIMGHDMAFHLDAPAFLADARVSDKGEPVLRSSLAEHGSSLRSIAAARVISFFRTDSERHPSAGESDLDISQVFTFSEQLERADVSAWCLLRCISVARHVRTDRLHVALGAALLGVPCDFYDNSYGKNRAVYEHSLRGFSRLRWVAHPTVTR